MNAFFKDSADFVTIVTAFFRTGFFLFVTVATCAFFDSMWVRSFEWVKHSEAFCFWVPSMISAEFSPGQVLEALEKRHRLLWQNQGHLFFFPVNPDRLLNWHWLRTDTIQLGQIHIGYKWYPPTCLTDMGLVRVYEVIPLPLPADTPRPNPGRFSNPCHSLGIGKSKHLWHKQTGLLCSCQRTFHCGVWYSDWLPRVITDQGDSQDWKMRARAWGPGLCVRGAS